jgi:hypothetical protein
VIVRHRIDSVAALTVALGLLTAPLVAEARQAACGEDEREVPRRLVINLKTAKALGLTRSRRRSCRVRIESSNDLTTSNRRD